MQLLILEAKHARACVRACVRSWAPTIVTSCCNDNSLKDPINRFFLFLLNSNFILINHNRSNSSELWDFYTVVMLQRKSHATCEMDNLWISWHKCPLPISRMFFFVRFHSFISVELQLLHILWGLWLKSGPHKFWGCIFKVDEGSVIFLSSR